ncbi:MAG: ATP-binding cassette domain-containing protein [Turneriella sp.]|nr:ATP-binding cassette domain-containing protein [Turneriella sp.]
MNNGSNQLPRQAKFTPAVSGVVNGHGVSYSKRAISAARPELPESSVLVARNIVHHLSQALTIHVPELCLNAGEILGILGPNGAGKTTLMNILSGSLRAHEGEILLQGYPLHRYNAIELAARRSVTRAGADASAGGLTAREVIELGSLTNPMPVRLLHVLVSCYAAALDLSLRLETEFALLSSGEKKRVEFARALVQTYGREQRHVLFMDEPFAHLDARHARAVRQEICYLLRRKVAVLCILHDINLAATLCDRIVFMREGKIIAQLPARQIYRPELLEAVYGEKFAVLRSGRNKYVVAKS